MHPFAFAYTTYCAYRYRSAMGICGGLSVCVGLFFFSGIADSITALGVLASVYAANKLSHTKPDRIKVSLLASAAVLSVGSVFCVATHGGILELMFVIASAATSLSLTHAFIGGFGALENVTNKKNYTACDIILINVCICALISGFGFIEIFGVNAAMVLSCAYILVSAYSLGAGLCLSCAVLNAASLCIFCGFDFSYMGLMCISALLCVLTSSLSKTVIAASFVAAVALGSLLIGQHEILTDVAACVCGTVIFFLCGGYIKKKSEEIKSSAKTSPLSLNETVKTVIKEEMSSQRNMLAEMARNVDHTSAGSMSTEDTVKTVCRMVSSDICPGCPSYASCWVHNAAVTYEAFGEAVRISMLNPSLNFDKLPKRFIAQCSKSRMMFKTIGYIYDSFKVKQACEVKINSMKSIVGHQFSHLSTILDRLYGRLSDGLHINTAEAGFAQSELENSGIDIDKLYIIEDFNKKKRVFVHTPHPLDDGEASREIPRVLCGVLGKEIIYDYASAAVKTDEGYCYVYSEQFPYRLSCGFAGCTKHEADFSGDSNTDTVLSNGIHAVAICDGMGSGLEASKQSERVLDMLEVLLNAGFDETKALDMINSVLVLDDSREIFAALDLFLFDLNKGIGEFVKAGACPSYIKRGRDTKKISYDSLPMGILEETHIHKGIQKFAKGDYVYFMSDGFFESVGSDEDYIRSSLLRHDYRNPQKVADALFTDALEKAGNIARDDVSIMVVKVRA